MPPPDRKLFGSQPQPGDPRPLPHSIFHDVKEMYEKADSPRSTAIFPGGFTNFGYWADLQNVPFNEKTRIDSQRNLYRLVFQKLGLTSNTNDAILEVACGKGKGLELLYNDYTPQGTIYGVDFLPQQVERTLTTLQGNPGRFRIYQNPAEDLRNIRTGTIDKALSVEAIQHFDSPEEFIGELGRVVRPDGQIAISSFFTQDPSAEDALKDRLGTFADGIDKAILVSDMRKWLQQSGFDDIEITPIKDDVLPYFSKWLDKIVHEDGSMPADKHTPWVDVDKGLLDYLVITAKKLSPERVLA